MFGWCWLFTTLDHFNSELLGFHVCKTGDRFAAAEPLRLAVRREFGAFTQGIAHGLTYRMDNGSQYTADHFKGELDFLGITASYSFVGSPECNGIAERFFRTLKEQVIYCRQFRNLEEAREAIARFVWDYTTTGGSSGSATRRPPKPERFSTRSKRPWPPDKLRQCPIYAGRFKLVMLVSH
jgi:transposase InsO family protein